MSLEKKDEKPEEEDEKEEPIEVFVAPEDIPSEEPLEEEKSLLKIGPPKRSHGGSSGRCVHECARRTDE
jgi:hypothetical protein